MILRGSTEELPGEWPSRTNPDVKAGTRLLLVADDPAAATLIKEALAMASSLPVETRPHDDTAGIAAILGTGTVAALLLDLRPGSSSHMTARMLIDAVKHRAPHVPIIVMAEREGRLCCEVATQPAMHDCLVGSADSLARVLGHTLEHRHLQEALRDSEEKYQRLMEISPDAILVYSKGLFVSLNEAAARLFGASEVNQMMHKPMVDFVHPTEWRAIRTDVTKSAAGNARVPFARRKLIRLDGSHFEAWVAATACRHDGDAAVQLVARIVSEHARLDQHLSYLSQYDLLTRLPNRSQFRDRLIGAMARARRNKQLTAMVFINIDSFQRVNTAFGQAVGDQVLKHLAGRLTRCTRASDTVARLGGDEFALTLEGLEQKDGAIVVAQRVLAAMSQPIVLEGRSVQVTVSIGIAVHPSDADDLDRLWRRADVAMQYAKQVGRNTYQFYLPEIEAQSRRGELRRLEIEQNLQRLTSREQEVLEMLVTGKANKMVAYLLGISPRTIENHRARIMDKMQADSLPELVRLMLDRRE